MDLFTLLPEKDWLEFTSNYIYKKDFMGQILFPAKKTNELKLSVMQLMENGNVPVMAKVHSFDTEALIGDRPDAELVNYEKLFIKEKIDVTERMIEFEANLKTNSAVIDFILNDAGNMLSRVITRTEVANMELLGTGKATYKENNVDITVDYKTNKGTFSGWNKPDADIIGDIQVAKRAALAKGYKLVRAITSDKIIQYMMKNTAILNYWANAVVPLTEDRLLEWLKDNFKIEFVVNEDVYKLSAKDKTTKRFYPENNITFLSTTAALGNGLFGVTPEERGLKDTSEKSFVTITQWVTKDPVANWVKASGLYVPVPKDPKGIFVYTHSDT